MKEKRRKLEAGWTDEEEMKEVGAADARSWSRNYYTRGRFLLAAAGKEEAAWPLGCLSRAAKKADERMARAPSCSSRRELRPLPWARPTTAPLRRRFRTLAELQGRPPSRRLP